MFDNPKSRRELIRALKAGGLNEAVIGRATAEIAHFGDITIEDLSWAFGHGDASAVRFAREVIIRSKEAGKLDKLKALLAEEQRPRAKAELSKLIQRCGGGGDGEESIAQIAQMINNRDAAVRKRGLERFLDHADWHGHRTMVTTLLDDPDPAIAEPMARAVAEKAPRAYIGRIRHLAEHAEDGLRDLCLQALIRTGDAVHADILIRRMPLEQPELRKAMYAALQPMMRADPTTITELLIVNLGDERERVRRGAMTLMAKLPDQADVFRRMLAYCAGVSGMVRERIFGELSNQADHYAGLALKLMEDEADPAVRLQVLELAKFLKSNTLAPLFLRELEHSDWLVRYAAMQVLGEMRSAQALPLLIKLLENPESSAAAIEALDKYRDIRLAKPFLARLPAANESEQLALLSAIENLGDGRLLPHLGKFLDSAAPKGKAKLTCAETIMRMCRTIGTAIPEGVRRIHDQLAEKTVEDLPDLGLKLADG